MRNKEITIIAPDGKEHKALGFIEEPEFGVLVIRDASNKSIVAIVPASCLVFSKDAPNE